MWRTFCEIRLFFKSCGKWWKMTKNLYFLTMTFNSLNLPPLNYCLYRAYQEQQVLFPN